jgi:hypothetical protein
MWFIRNVCCGFYVESVRVKMRWTLVNGKSGSHLARTVQVVAARPS